MSVILIYSSMVLPVEKTDIYHYTVCINFWMEEI